MGDRTGSSPVDRTIQKSLKTLSFLAFLMPKKSQIPLFLPLLGFFHPFSPHSETRKTQRRGRLRLILDNSIGTAEALPVAMSDLGVDPGQLQRAEALPVDVRNRVMLPHPRDLRCLLQIYR